MAMAREDWESEEGLKYLTPGCSDICQSRDIFVVPGRGLGTCGPLSVQVRPADCVAGRPATA
jgi:hypothetical protein